MKKILFGIILIFTANQSVHSSESIINKMIDDDFIAWSNSIPKEEAEIQLKDFLSSFNSWEEAKIWLTSKGFKAGKSRLIGKKLALHYGINEYPVFAHGVVWRTDRQGIIFANGWLRKLGSQVLAYGVSVGIYYADNGKFIVFRVEVTELIL